MKIEKKLECYIWWFIRILPLLLIFISFFSTGYSFEFSNSKPIDEYAVSLFTQFHFTPIYSILVQIFTQYFTLQMTSGVYIVCAYCSYLFFVELVHILFLALIFIFKICRKWLERCF